MRTVWIVIDKEGKLVLNKAFETRDQAWNAYRGIANMLFLGIPNSVTVKELWIEEFKGNRTSTNIYEAVSSGQ